MEEVSLLNINTKNTLYSYISQITAVVSGFLLSVALVRNLEIKEYGEYNFLLSSITFLGIIVSLGLESTLQRYVTEFNEKKFFGKINNLFFWTISIRLICLILFSIILFLFHNKIQSAFSLTIGSTGFILFICIFILSKLKQLIGASLLTAYLLVFRENQNNIIYNISRLILFSSIVYQGYGLSIILLAWVFIEVITFLHYLIYVTILIKKNFQNNGIDRFTIDEKKRIIKFSKYQGFAVFIFIFADIAIDNIMIGYYLDQVSLAKYALATTILLMVSKFNPVSLLRPMLTSLAVKNYSKRKSIHELKEQYFVLSKISILVCSPIFLLLAINAENIIIIIYGNGYIDSKILIYYGSFFFLIREFNPAILPLLNALEKNKLFLYSGIFSIYNLIANFFLIPKFGEIGALFATGSAIIMIFVFYIYHIRKINVPIYFPWQDLFKIFLSLLPILIVGLYLNSMISNIFHLLTVIIFEFLIYILILYLIKFFTKKEREQIEKYFGIKRSKILI